MSDAGSPWWALVPTSMGIPLMFAKLPGLFALVDEGLLALLGFVCICSTRFGVQVVVLVLVDRGQPLRSMLVYFIMVVVQNGLPCLLVLVVDLGVSLPGASGVLWFLWM